MSSRHMVLVMVLSGALAGCGGGGAPEANATNCSGAGMQAVLPTFDNEAERQAFIDKCQSLVKN